LTDKVSPEFTATDSTNCTTSFKHRLQCRIGPKHDGVRGTFARRHRV